MSIDGFQKLSYICYTNYDARFLNSWSNVPFFFAETLKAEKGKEHVFIDSIFPKPGLSSFLFKVLNRFWSILFRGTLHSFHRSLAFRIITNHRIEKMCKRHSPLDVLIVFTYSYLPKVKQKTVLFCDWPLWYELLYHQKRKPSFFERMDIRNEDRNIVGSDYVITFFPYVYEKLKERYNNAKNIYYIGHFINSTIQTTENDLSRFIKIKKASSRILFIGGPHYRQAAISLIKVVEKINTLKGIELSVDVVGLKEEQAVKSRCANYYGYLDKSNEKHAKKYYELMEGARVIINNTENWSSASSIIEALSFGTPFILCFNENINKLLTGGEGFGIYIDNSPQSLENAIWKMVSLKDEEYSKMAEKAWTFVNGWTWKNYITKMIALIETENGDI